MPLLQNTSTVPQLIDALVARWSALPALTALSRFVCSDGWWAGDHNGVHLLQVGGREEPVAEGSTDWALAIGGGARDESYQLQCYAYASVGGASQKAARDEAFKLVAAVEADLQADPQVGSTLNYPCHFGGVSLLEQTASKREAAQGRFARVTFAVAVPRNRLRSF